MCSNCVNHMLQVFKVMDEWRYIVQLALSVHQTIGFVKCLL